MKTLDDVILILFIAMCGLTYAGKTIHYKLKRANIYLRPA